MYKDYFDSPIGTLQIVATTKGIQSVQFIEKHTMQGSQTSEVIKLCINQLQQYFRGDLQDFHSLPLAYGSTDFQDAVWCSAQQIPYGTSVTYSDLASSIGSNQAQRAVGTALGANPLLIITPCHRIVPASGGIGNFAAGVWRKQWLLEHEAKFAIKS
jgi:methylated-DNA-[protein]-cysteine S-methyltransferase